MRHARQWFGLRLFAWVIGVWWLAATTVAQAVTQDLTGQFAITRSGLVLNRTSNTFDSTVTLKNASDAPVLAPIDVVVGGLPAGITLANKAGDKPDGRPYISPMSAGSLLQGGGALTFVLKFANPSRATFSSTLQVLRTVVEAPANAPSLLGIVATGAASAHVIGRVDGAPNQDIQLQLTSANTCIAGTLVNGANVGGAVTARTDAGGYFQFDVSGVNPGAFVALTNGTAGSAPSLCQVNSRDNTSWPKAFLLDGSAPTARDLIDLPGRARWYKFAVSPGQRIDIKLTGLAADYDLAAFKDIGQAFASQFNPATAGTSELLKLTAEYAPSTFSPSTFSPSTFSPSTFSPDAYSPSTFSPSTFSESVFSPSTFSPSTFSPSTFSPSTFSPSTFSPSTFSPSTFSPSTFSPSTFSATEIAQAFSTAQTRSIVAISATAGLSNESTVVNTWNRTGFFYVRVTGRGSAFDTSIPFTLSVTKGVTSCAGITDTVLTPRPAVPSSGLKTVMLTDSSITDLDAALPGPAGGTLRSRLAAFAARSEIKGVVVDVAGDGRVGALRQQAAKNPACPYAKNLVAEEIKGIVDAYRANPLQYVVLVGGDDAIPFFRSPDESAIGRESGYVPPVQSNSPSEASLRRDFVLSQDRYGSKTSISLPWNDFPVPGLAVGRLVETPSEIAGLIDAYVEADSVVSPQSSLVTGYDFLEDAATAVKSELDAGIGKPGDALITPNGTSPQAAASWTATQLRAKLFGSRHDVIFLAGHFTANSALAADFATSVLTTDLAASSNNFTNSIVFSAGCHAGYSLVDDDAIPGVTLPLDWAQAFARKQATLVAGTGYQYGDTDFLEYNERLYNNFARQLRAGPPGTTVSVGEALVQAKLAYLQATPDIRGLHEKALLQAALFGLPMLGVNMPAGRGELPGTAPIISPTTVTSGPAATLGLQTYDLGVAPNLTARTQTLTNLQGGPNVIATWLSGPDGVVTKPGEPALPLTVVNVTPTVPTVVLRGIGYRGGSYVDTGPLIPFTGAATTESRGVHVPFLSPVFYPSTMWTPNYFGALAGTGGTQLLISPVQYRAASVAAGTSTQRQHTGMNLRLFYSGNLSQAALSDAPSIVAVDAQQDATGVTFAALVVGDPAAAIHQVWVTYTGEGLGTWTSVDLGQCVAPLPATCASEDSRLWKGRVGSPPANLKYFVQAVNGVGLVSRSDNVGAYFGIASPAQAATAITLITPPSSAIVGDSPAVTAKLAYAGGVGLAGKIVAVGAGGTMRLGTTGSDGSVTVRLPVVADPGSYLITAAFAGDESYQPASTSSPLTINRAAVTPTVLPPSQGAATAGINITGALGGTNTSLQGVPVTFTVNVAGNPNPVTVTSITDYLGNAIFPPPSGLPPGNYTVTQASFGGNGTFAPTTITFPTPLQVSVPKLDQGIEFDALATKTFGDPDFGLFASASSGLAVAYGASGACTVVGSTVHLTGTGSCTLSADQPGDATYNPAAQVTRTFAIGASATAPTVVSLVRAMPSPTMADVVTYTVTFSEPVNGVTSNNFAVVPSGMAGAAIATISGADGTATRIVGVSTGRGTGSLHLDLVNGTGITNGANVPLTGVPVTGDTYDVDKGGTVIGAGQGQLVTGFGNGGYALFSEDPQGIDAFAVLADGRILAAGGRGCNGTDCVLQLARYSASGVPDVSFGTNGRVVTGILQDGFSASTGIFANADGTFFVTGVHYNAATDVEVPFVAKFTSTGAPDPSYGSNGIAVLDSLPWGFFFLVGTAIDSSGRIVIASSTSDINGQADVLVTRLTSVGAIDASFGTNGVAQFALSTSAGRSTDVAASAVIQPDGKIVIGGRTFDGGTGGNNFFAMRLDANGARDPSFGTNGVSITRFPTTGGNNNFRELALQPDGKIVLVGNFDIVGELPQGTLHCGVVRFNADGTLDTGFGNGGRLVEPFGAFCTHVTVQPDGKLVLVESSQVGDVFYNALVRLLQTGAPDLGFGNAGRLLISTFGGFPRIAVAASGNLLNGVVIEDTADGIQKSYVIELTSTLAGPWVNQTITFNGLPDSAYGNFFNPSATASSGSAVTFAAAGACTLAGNLVQITGIGNCTITANQAGNATFFPAPSVSRTFAVGKANQVIGFAPAPTGVNIGQILVTVTATSSSPNAPPSTIPITLSSLTPGVCTTSGSNGASLSILAPGLCTITANQPGNANYNPAPQATLDFTVSNVSGAPATFTVTNLNDSGAGSLRNAVAQANATPGADIVNFAPGLTGTIVLTSGVIGITGPLSIVGPGSNLLTIDGNASNRMFSVVEDNALGFPGCPALSGPSDYLVSISGLTLSNGQRHNDSSGGAIHAEKSLSLDNVVVQNSMAKNGGGVAFFAQYPGQTLTITNSRFLNNIAKPLSAVTSGTHGGALYVDELCDTRITPVTVTIANSTFTGNRVQPVDLSGRGGAITSFAFADITITDTRIVDNHVDAPNPPVATRNYRGGGIYGTAKSLRIERSEVSDNSNIEATNSSVTRGGGVAVFNDPPDLQTPSTAMALNIVNSTISGNTDTAFGGALWVFGNVAVSIANSTIADNNAAANNTGGIRITTGTTNPVSSSNAAPPRLSLASTILSDNTPDDIATNTAAIPTFGISADHSLIQTICATCAISVSGPGNLIGADPGLGLLAFNGGTTRTHAPLAGSPGIDAGSNPLALATDQRGSGFLRSNGVTDIGAYETGNAAPPPPTGQTFTVTNTNDSGAGSLRDAIAQANASPGADTIIFAVEGTIVLTSGQIKISDQLLIVGPGADRLTIDGNANGRIFSIFSTDPACPALDGPDYAVNIRGLRLVNARRTSSNGGGAIFSEHSLVLEYVVLENNTAGHGAGVFFSIQYPNQNLTVVNSQFLNNIAQPLAASPSNSQGGALSAFERCSGTWTSPVYVVIQDSLLSGNRAQPVALSGFGGALAMYNNADVSIVNSRIVGNSVVRPDPPVADQLYSGGAMNLRTGSLFIYQSEIADNSANFDGGIAVFNNAASLQGPESVMVVDIVNSTISGNTVTNPDAGAIGVLDNVSLDIHNSTISNNNPAPAAGGWGIGLFAGATDPPSGINATAPTLHIQSSIVANNSTSPPRGDIVTFQAPFTIDATSSLIKVICPACNILPSGAGNILGVDPVLGPLAFNGGTTRTHALLAGSPAINTGGNQLLLPTDQRGIAFPRSVAATDMGAYEAGTPIPFGNFAYASQFGSPGSGNGQFSYIPGIAIDPTSHNIVVTDVNNGRVQIFSSAGVYLSQFGSFGSGNGQFSSHYNVAIDPTSHNILVSEVGNARVQIFDSSGVYLSQFGSSGTGNGEFNRAEGIAVDPVSHNIVVADAANNRVQIFNSAGVYLSQFGTTGTGNEQFLGPTGIAIDPTTRNIVVVDGNRVQIFSAAGEYLSQFGTAGSGNGQFSAYRVAIDPTSHNIIVGDLGNRRVQIFNSAGVYLSQLGTFGTGDGQFDQLLGVAVDPSSHNIAVTDGVNNRVQIFAPVGAVGPPPVPPQPNGFLDTPTAGSEISGTILVSGWTFANTPITGVQILLDGNVIGAATLGFARPDIPIAFPGAPANSGYRFVFNSTLFPNGGHVLAAVATDSNGITRTWQAPITINQSNDVLPPETNLDEPQTNSTVGGTILLEGWAVDNVAVSSVSILLDGNVIGTATLGISRPDVQAAYPWAPLGSGFEFLFNTALYPNGVHFLASVAFDAAGNSATKEVTMTIANQGGAASPNYAYASKFGSIGSGNGQFISPQGVAIDPTSRNIVVADYNNHRVQIFSSAGAYLSQFGTAGSGNGEFNGPFSVAIDPSTHNIAVGDFGNKRIQIFSSAGAYLSQFGSLGSGDGQFNGVFNVAIDPISHKIVVVDTGNNRVQIFSSAGVYQSQFGSVGNANAQFNNPYGIAIDPADQSIVVADTGNNRVQIFSLSGVYVGQFGMPGTGNGQFNFPYGVAIDPASHNIVVTEGNNKRVQVFDSSGVYLSQFGSFGDGDGQFNLPFGVAIDPTSRNIVVTDPNNHRVQIFAPTQASANYAYLSQFGSSGAGNGQFDFPFGVTIGPASHNIVVTDSDANRVQIFSSIGAYLSQFGTSGTGDGQFAFPTGVAIDPTSPSIVVADTGNNRIQIFSAGGVYVNQFGTFGTGNGQFSSPVGVAIDPTSHNIVVTDFNNHRVQIFSSAGGYLGQFGTIGTGDGQFQEAYGIAIDPTSHNIVVTDRAANRAQIFSSTGVYLGQFGTSGGGNGQFNDPNYLAIDPISRNIIVADGLNHRVQIFSSAGVYLGQFGSVGDGNGQFQTSLGLAIDPITRNVVVTDPYNVRVQIFAPQ